MQRDIFSFLFDHHTVVFGSLIALIAIALVAAGQPRRWWSWALGVGGLLVLLVASAALAFFWTASAALDRRVESLTIQPMGETAMHRISDYRGKVVLINYWATWCGPCRAEIPAINRAVAAWRGRGVVFLALSDEDEPTIRRFLAKYPMDATIARFRSDAPSGTIARIAYQGRPTTLVLDRTGHVRRQLIGARHFEELDEAIRALYVR